MCTSFRCSVLEVDPKSIYYLFDVKYYIDQVLGFFLFDKPECIKWYILVCNSCHYIIQVVDLFNFFFVPQDLIGKINIYPADQILRNKEKVK